MTRDCLSCWHDWCLNQVRQITICRRHNTWFLAEVQLSTRELNKIFSITRGGKSFIMRNEISEAEFVISTRRLWHSDLSRILPIESNHVEVRTRENDNGSSRSNGGRRERDEESKRGENKNKVLDVCSRLKCM